MQELIWVAGHRGMVGSAVVRALSAKGRQVLTVARADLDLMDQRAVEDWVRRHKPSSVILCAARVGGISANAALPVEFLLDNLCIQTNTISAAHKADVNNLVFLGSSCIYPRLAGQPIKESSLLTGSLEPTNESYAIAKISGIKLCQAYMKQYGRRYISVMPCNLYGSGDNFDLNSSHVIPALIHKMMIAKRQGNPSVQVWGSGNPLREFMHVDDLAAGVIYCHDNYSGLEQINCGSGMEVTVRHLTGLIAPEIGFEGSFEFDTSKPDGPPRKVMDSGRLRALGWSPEIELADGLRTTVEWFQATLPMTLPYP